MPYIERDQSGKIVGVFANPQPQATEYTIDTIDVELSYQSMRAAAYPPLTDFADAFFWLQNGDASKMAAYLESCENVKNTYPKPEDQ